MKKHILLQSQTKGNTFFVTLNASLAQLVRASDC